MDNEEVEFHDCAQGWGFGMTKGEVLATNPDQFYFYIEITAPSGEIWNIGKFIGEGFTPKDLCNAWEKLHNLLLAGVMQHQKNPKGWHGLGKDDRPH